MQTSLMDKKLLTVSDTQKLLSIGRTKVFSLMASGELHSVLIGSSRRIPIVAIEEFLERLNAMANKEESSNTHSS